MDYPHIKFKAKIEAAEMAESAYSSGESLFIVPFNLFYYFGFVPFKTRHNPKTNRYELHTRFVQKIICVFSNIVAIMIPIYYLVSGCLQFKANPETNVVELFFAVSNLTFTSSILLLMFYIWRQQQEYLEFLELSRCNRKQRSFGKLSMSIGLLANCIYNVAVSWFLINDSGHFTNQMIMFPYNSTPSTKETANVTMSRNESVYEVCQPLRFHRFMHYGNIMMYMYSACFFGFVNGLLYVLTFVLVQVGIEFRTELEKTKDELDFDKGIRIYRKLKETTNFTRKMLGDYVLTFYVSTVTYCVQAPHIWMGKRGDTEKVMLFAFFLFNIVWIYAAEFHHKVHTSIIEWLTVFTECESLSLEDRLKLLSIRGEVSDDPIAMSCRCFNVTYQHLSSMLGVVATYGVIVIQLNQD